MVNTRFERDSSYLEISLFGIIRRRLSRERIEIHQYMNREDGWKKLYSKKSEYFIYLDATTNSLTNTHMIWDTILILF